jgi:hypothetical protein
MENGNGKAHDDVHRFLPVELTEKERAKHGDAIGAMVGRIERLQDERAGIGAAIKEAAAERDRLGKILAAGVEDRKVMCRWIEDPIHATKRLVRQDTGATLEERTMTAADRQRGLGFDGDDDKGDELGPDDDEGDDQDDELAAGAAASAGGAVGGEETIDLDDVPDDDTDDEDLDDDDVGGEDVDDALTADELREETPGEPADRAIKPEPPPIPPSAAQPNA